MNMRRACACECPCACVCVAQRHAVADVVGACAQSSMPYARVATPTSEVLDAAVAEVCKYAPDNEGVDLLRRSLQKFYARTLGERDFGLFEAVHLGLRLPLVTPLVEVMTLNTLGTRRFKTLAEASADGHDGPATWDSKVDKFDMRRALVAADKRRAVALSEVEHTSLYEFHRVCIRLRRPRIYRARMWMGVRGAPGLG